MLSAVIPSKLSYSTMLLAEQPIHQRFVLFGPLVTYFPCFQRCRLYLHPDSIGSRHIIMVYFFNMKYPLSYRLSGDKVVTGSTLKFSTAQSLIFSFSSHNFQPELLAYIPPVFFDQLAKFSFSEEFALILESLWLGFF